MGGLGATPISMRGDAGWSGMTTQSKAMPFRFELLENCYVNSNGSEIRMMPGFVCVIDPATNTRTYANTSTTGPSGYETIHVDARRKVAAASTKPYYSTQGDGADELMYIWNRPSTVHFAEQVHDRWLLVGESTDRFEPIFNSGRTAFVYVTSYSDNGTSITLNLNTACSESATLANAIYGHASFGNRIYLEGLTGSLASILNGKSHYLNAATAGTAITISTTSGGVASGSSQFGTIARVTNLSSAASSTTISDDIESLTTWAATSLGDPTASVVNTVYPAHVANRQRDFGDETGNVKEGLASTVLTIANGGARSRRRQKGLPYRMVPHVAGNRIVIAAPGYGCAFQVPVVTPIDYTASSGLAGVQWWSNDIYDRPRCVGVPKATQWEDPYKTIAAGAPGTFHQYEAADAEHSFGGTSEAARAGRYRFKFAYKDEATGEIGLCSEPVEVTSSGTGSPLTHNGLRFVVYFPGYLMHECLALSINVYRTAKDGETYYFDRNVPMNAFQGTRTALTDKSSKYGLEPQASGTYSSYYLHAVYEAVYQTDELLVKQDGQVPESVEQMPMGCKAARTIRGWTFYGGALGNAGPMLEMQLGTLTLEYDQNGFGSLHKGSNPDYNQVTSRYTNFRTNAPGAELATFQGFEDGFGCSAFSIPPAYAGQVISSRTMLPYPRQLLRLNKLENTKVDVWDFNAGTRSYPFDLSSRIPDVRYSVLDTPIESGEDLYGAEFRTEPVHLILPRGKIQISEPDNPGVVPATNTTVIANELDEDVEAIGVCTGQAVICSRSKTYYLGFGQSPIGQIPQMADDKFGCIAPNSMVEFDGGCAWMSDRGPVAFMGGQVQWIGEPLEKFFTGETSRYKRDSRGMMLHAWACHDSERCLIYFGMFRDRAAGTDQRLTANFRGTSYNWTTAGNVSDGNKIKSRFACDEILVFSYKTGSWSIWTPPTCIGIQWMTQGKDDSGNRRVFFLGSDKRLYALDDTYGHFDRESNYQTVSQTGSVTTVTVSATGIKIRAGMTAMFYTGGGGSPLAYLGKRTVASLVADTSITLDSAITIPRGGCKMIVGARQATIRTTYSTWKGTESSALGSLGMRFSLLSRYSAGLSNESNVQAAFINASVRATKRRDQEMIDGSVTLTGPDENSYSPLGVTSTSDPVYTVGLSSAEVSGQNHQVEINVIGGAQVRISDIFAQVK